MTEKTFFEHNGSLTIFVLEIEHDWADLQIAKDIKYAITVYNRTNGEVLDTVYTTEPIVTADVIRDAVHTASTLRVI